MSTSRQEVSYDRHFDKVGFLGEGAGGGDSDQQHFFEATKKNDYHLKATSSTSTFVKQTVLVVSISLLANALLLGLFWYLVLLPSHRLNQEVKNGSSLQLQHHDLQPCGHANSNWTAYLDEKCILVVDEVRSFKESEDICQKLDASAELLSIDSPDEQAFLEDIFFKDARVVNPIWLANNGSSSDDVLAYSNWLLGKEKILKTALEGSLCTEMLIPDAHHLLPLPSLTSENPPTPKPDTKAGHWTLVPCTKRNLVVCQKRQNPWSPKQLREELLLTRNRLKLLTLASNKAAKRQEVLFTAKESEIKNRLEVFEKLTKATLEETVNGAVTRAVNETCKDLEKRFQELDKASQLLQIQAQHAQNQQNHLQVSASTESAVPVGFIYTQLPRSPSPDELWPEHIWTDISWTYSGVFFRVVGGGAATFGEVQDGWAPHLDQVEAKMCIHKPNGACQVLGIEESITMPKEESQAGAWSGWVNTAGAYLYEKEAARLDRDALRFHVTGGEVRPRNMAVKVWKRTA